MKWVTCKALCRSEVKYSHENCKALAFHLLKPYVKLLTALKVTATGVVLLTLKFIIKTSISGVGC